METFNGVGHLLFVVKPVGIESIRRTAVMAASFAHHLFYLLFQKFGRTHAGFHQRPFVRVGLKQSSHNSAGRGIKSHNGTGREHEIHILGSAGSAAATGNKRAGHGRLPQHGRFEGTEALFAALGEYLCHRTAFFGLNGLVEVDKSNAGQRCGHSMAESRLARSHEAYEKNGLLKLHRLFALDFLL